MRPTIWSWLMALLRQPVSSDNYRRFIESWRVAAGDSFLCDEGKVAAGMPTTPVSAGDLDPQKREHAQTACIQAGVKNGPLLDDCMLDVGIVGSDSAADVFVHAPPVKKVIKPSTH